MNGDDLIKYAIKRANKFNVFCLLVVALMALISQGLIELDIFVLNKNLGRISLSIVVITSCTPLLVWIFNDYVLKKESALYKPYFKYLILSCAYLSVLDIGIAAYYFTSLIIALPSMMVALYKNNKRSIIGVFVVSILFIIIITYGSFLFGDYDANILKPLTYEEALVLQNRIALLNAKKIFELFIHYAVPRLFAFSALIFIGLAISSIHVELLDMQISLSDKVNDEMLKKTKMQNSVIEHLADIIESRDLDTGEHIKRTKEYVSILIDKMKDDDHFKDDLENPKIREDIVNAAPLHDIGKIAVSDLILCKPGKLTDEEFEKMKIHTVKGGEIINSILQDMGDKDFIKTAYDIAISHHEKWNGKGYPYGLKGKEIPLAGRIMAIADVFDALVSERVYKKPVSVEEARAIIVHDAGTHFDPFIVEDFKSVFDKFKYVALTK